MNESMQKLITKELKNQETAVAAGDLENAVQIGEGILGVLHELLGPRAQVLRISSPATELKQPKWAAPVTGGWYRGQKQASWRYH